MSGSAANLHDVLTTSLSRTLYEIGQRPLDVAVVVPFVSALVDACDPLVIDGLWHGHALRRISPLLPLIGRRVNLENGRGTPQLIRRTTNCVLDLQELLESGAPGTRRAPVE